MSLEQPSPFRPWEVVRRVKDDQPYDPWAEDAARRQGTAAYGRAHDAKAAEEASDWFAAVFHLDRLIRLTPDDPSLPERRKAAAAHLSPEFLAILDRSKKAAEQEP